MKDYIKLCPFCGDDAQVKTSGLLAFVECCSCRAVGPEVYIEDAGVNYRDTDKAKEEAVKRWNDRTIDLEVEVTRCKDCKYVSDDEYCHCKYVTWWNGKDDFCSRAERRR